VARTMARMSTRNSRTGDRAGPGTGPVTEALIARHRSQKRLVLVEFNPGFCRILRSRFPEATVVQGDAYSLKRTLATC
jgi:phosphatidylethanolamine/phosphatidyl-N-methylethanolamine N-methyltransferase